MLEGLLVKGECFTGFAVNVPRQLIAEDSEGKGPFFILFPTLAAVCSLVVFQDSLELILALLIDFLSSEEPVLDVVCACICSIPIWI